MDYDLSFCFDVDMVLTESPNYHITSSTAPIYVSAPVAALSHDCNSFDSDVPALAFKRRVAGKNWTRQE